ncbi:hypothetical protein CCR94_17830 [Rhodoblastus sphagnicola]|uniref:TonB-dependent receptor n=1 Tax=Rhodoblastus sphagnicola TaxID=333368 RepID=A0A2S6N1E2_9HYPH|nr:TonB-dependent receptor [Rhodoblastus sphagnicola]MBB4199007.1 iron complex outermembrane receptor protein [Rhodoblastus sphagnicola]PPQ28419.1 hypothetical protein CCR94_17830 [Rhodoblastus sphagnicola]
MKLKTLAIALLASTALPAFAVAQTAAQPTADAAASASPAPAANAVAAHGDSRAMGGLTASPTDFGTVHAGAGADASGAPGDGAPNAFGVTRTDIGGGYMIEEDATKSRSTATRDAIDKLSPSANPYQIISALPGANVSNPDNLGVNNGNIRLRGFNSDHLGLTIEGVPINDSGSYALYPQEYIDAENMGSISIAQGSPDLDSPHIGAIGGVMNLYMIDPSKTAGGVASVSAGTNYTFREFARVDTGQVGDTRAFLSVSHVGDAHWNGLGRDDRYNVEFKNVWDLSPGNTVRLSILYNDADSNTYPSLYLSDYKSGNYAGNYTKGGQGTSSNWYGYKINPFRNLIVSAPSNFTFTPELTYDVIPYFWYGYGNGGGVSSLASVPAGAASGGSYFGNLRVTGLGSGSGSTLYYTPSNTETFRPGIINKLGYTLNDHKLTIGYWVEDALQIQTGPVSPLTSNGTIGNVYGDTNVISLPSTAVCYVTTTKAKVACPTSLYEKRNAYTHTLTNDIFAGDVWSVNDKLTLELGAKEAFVNRSVVNETPYDPTPRVSVNDAVFLPQAAIRYKIDDNNQVFASVNTTFRSTPNYGMYNIYSLTSASLTQGVNVVKPERGYSFEIGHRYQGEAFTTSVSGFLARILDMQQSASVPDPDHANQYVSELNDIGRVLVYGVDGEVGTRRWNDFRAYGSFELLHTEMQDNVPGYTTAYKLDYAPTKGKQLPGSPNYLFGLGVDYDNGHVIGNLLYKVTGAQYGTFVNDERIPAYGTLNGMIGYRFSDYGFAKAPTIQLNLFNLFDKHVLTGLTSTGATINGAAVTGVKGGTMKGNSGQYYVSQGFSALLSLKTAF